MKKKRPNPHKTDTDNPGWTKQMFEESKPFKEAFPKLYDSWKRSRGRPKSAAPKINTTLRLGQDIVAALKASGRGYNTKVEKILRQALEDGRI